MKTIEVTLYTVWELKEQFPEAFERAIMAYANQWDDPWCDDRRSSMRAILGVLGCPNFDPARPFRNDAEGVTGLDLYNAIRKLRRDDFYPTGYTDDRDFAEAAVDEYERGARTGRECAWNFDTVWDRIMQREYESATSEEGFIEHCEGNDITFTASGEVY